MLGEVFMVVVVPALAGAIVVGVLWSTRRLAALPRLRDAGVGLVPGLVFALAFAVAVGVPSLPPEKMWHGLFHLGVAAAVVAALVGIVGMGRPLLSDLCAVALAMSAAWLLKLPEAAAGVSMLSLALAVGVGALLVGRIDCSSGGTVVGIGGWATFSGVSVLAFMSNQPSLAMSCGAVAVVLAAMVVLKVVLSRPRSGVLCIGGVAVGGLAGAAAMTGWAYDYGDVAWWQWLVCGCGLPAAALCLPDRGVGGWSTPRRWLGSSVAVAFPLIAVLWALSMGGGEALGG